MTESALIVFDRVEFRYQDAAQPALRDVTLAIPEGELVLVAGPTGSGKSTLLQLVNGLAPHFTGGRLTGSVTVAGRSTRSNVPRDFADLVGVVGQDPAAAFVTSRVDDELAYGMEQLGLNDNIMRTRVEEVIDLLGLESVRHRELRTLSAGEQQRVAIGAVLTSHPRVLVLDEPTSALDPSGAEEVLSSIMRLVHDGGVTVLMAEHRLERVIQYADSMVLLGADGRVQSGSPASMLRASSLVPPIIELGRVAQWARSPLSIRDARRAAGPLRDRLSALPSRAEHGELGSGPRMKSRTATLRVRGLRVDYGDVRAVAGVDCDLHAGEIAAVMGRNGSGKTSLLWAIHGAGPRTAGTVTPLPPGNEDPKIALVPQNPSDLLYLDSVAAECELADRTTRSARGTAAALLETLAPGLPESRHPRDLSEGERLALVLAVQLSRRPRILLLDEPTRGLDYAAKRRLTDVLKKLADEGTSVLLSSHDVEFVATVATRVLVLAHGDVLSDGPALEVLTASPSFAPQVAKIMHPLPLLTVDAVRHAISRTSA